MRQQIYQQGQALITLLFFIAMASIITSAAITLIATNIATTSNIEQGTLAYYAAESGMENTFLRLLRDPTYTGETLAIDTMTAVATVSGSNPKTITVTGINGSFQRKVQATMTYTNGYYTFTAWKEVQ